MFECFKPHTVNGAAVAEAAVAAAAAAEETALRKLSLGNFLCIYKNHFTSLQALKS